jgi:hypothetical protein
MTLGCVILHVGCGGNKDDANLVHWHKGWRESSYGAAMKMKECRKRVRAMKLACTHSSSTPIQCHVGLK